MSPSGEDRYCFAQIWCVSPFGKRIEDGSQEAISLARTWAIAMLHSVADKVNRSPERERGRSLAVCHVEGVFELRLDIVGPMAQCGQEFAPQPVGLRHPCARAAAISHSQG